MVTVDDLTPGSELPAPMEITVEAVDWGVRGRRAEVKAVDKLGNPILLIDFKGYAVDIPWQQSCTYRVSQCGVKSGRGEYDLQLEPTNDTIIEPAESESHVATLFVFGDTHVGYRHRKQSNKNKWSSKVDCRKIFSKCIERAKTESVDAVIHAGDVFDHGNTLEDRNFVKNSIDELVESGIPFCYIHGNHDNEEGKDALAGSKGIHLSQNPEVIGEQSLNLLGVDHSGFEFPTSPPSRSATLSRHANILVTHEKLYPVVDDAGTLIYDRSGNIAEISEYFLETSYDIEHLITGHQHLAKRGAVRGLDIPVLVTGSPAQLRKPVEDNPFAVWTMTVQNDGIELYRNPI